jgi:hypothetical protein
MDGAVGESDREFSGDGVEFEVPAALVYEVVMSGTPGDEPVEVGVAVVGVPFVEVMDLAVVEGYVAVADAAGAVDRSEGASLVVGGESAAASHVERDAVAVQHDRDDVGVAGETAQGLDRQWGAVVEFAHRGLVEALRDRREVDQGEDFGPAGAPGSARRGGQLDQ